MDRNIMIEELIKKVSMMPDSRIKEMADFANFLMKLEAGKQKYDHQGDMPVYIAHDDDMAAVPSSYVHHEG